MLVGVRTSKQGFSSATVGHVERCVPRNQPLLLTQDTIGPQQSLIAFGPASIGERSIVMPCGFLSDCDLSMQDRRVCLIK